MSQSPGLGGALVFLAEDLVEADARVGLVASTVVARESMAVVEASAQAALGPTEVEGRVPRPPTAAWMA
jgi:hypothetical protein